MICINMSLRERVFRIVFSVLFIAISPLGFDVLPGALIGWLIFFFGLVNLASSFAGWCFMYSLVGISSLRDDESTLRPPPPESEDKFESLDVMRRKMFIGFSLITLLVSGFYVFEGYNSAVNFGRKMEYRHLEANTHIIIDELEEHITSFSDVSKIDLSKGILEEVLYHFEHPMLILVQVNSDTWSASKGISNENSVALQKIVQGRIDSADSALVLTNHPSTSGEGIDLILEEFDGQEYAKLQHELSDGVILTTVQRFESSSLALKDVVCRLATSSLFVLWLGLWGAHGIATFVTKRIEASNRKILKAALTDSVTDVLNERAMKHSFKEMINRRSSSKKGITEDSQFRFTLIHFRCYSQIQQDHGNDIANQLLLMIAKQLRSSLPESVLLGRLNDGNFLTIQQGKQIESYTALHQVIHETLSVDAYQFALDSTEIILNYPEDGEEFDTLLKNAAITLQRALKDRMPRLQFNQQFLERSKLRSKYASELKSALSSNQFELYFQPKVSLVDQRIIGAEALIRWNHPTDGLLTPYQFLDILINSNVRRDFALFVIEQTARCQKELLDQGYDIKLSFNLNAYDINDSQVISFLKKTLSQFEIPCGYLQIELTETETSVNMESTSHALRKISDLGYSVAIDDFGTGMSSLAYCQTLPIDTIKIDRSFVLSLDSCNHSQLLVKAVIDMACNLDWEVIAEGIETSEIASTLKTLGCGQGQGYYFAKPMPFAALYKRLEIAPSCRLLESSLCVS